jgi:hypothetical protein
MNYRMLKIGDIVSRLKFPGVRHVGVVVGPDAVCHNTPERGEHVSTIAEFAAGQEIAVKHSGITPAVIIANAKRILANPKRYDAAVRNCEHTVSEILSGIAESSAVAVCGIVGILLAVLGLASLSKK